MAKKGQKFQTYTADFKYHVILDMRTYNLSYRETVRRYLPHIKQARSGISIIQRWERKYLEGGMEALSEETRGRKTLSGKQRGRKPKLDKKVEEDLIAENQRLKMEIECLKKLNALVQERIERESKNK